MTQPIKALELRRQVENIQFDQQLSSLFKRAKSILHIPEPGKTEKEMILGFIQENNDTARMLQKPEFLEINKKEKELKGDCKLGTVICIDGRISIIHQFGRTINTWEVAGSLVESELRTDGKIYLSSQRLIDALEKTAISPEGRELLEIVTAHTSSNPDHKCSKITGVAKKAHKKPSEIDAIALATAELRAQAIENKYNEIYLSTPVNREVFY